MSLSAASFCSLESEEGGLDQGTTEVSLMNYGLSQFIENH